MLVGHQRVAVAPDLVVAAPALEHVVAAERAGVQARRAESAGVVGVVVFRSFGTFDAAQGVGPGGIALDDTVLEIDVHARLRMEIGRNVQAEIAVQDVVARVADQHVVEPGADRILDAVQVRDHQRPRSVERGHAGFEVDHHTRERLAVVHPIVAGTAEDRVGVCIGLQNEDVVAVAADQKVAGQAVVDEQIVVGRIPDHHVADVRKRFEVEAVENLACHDNPRLRLIERTIASVAQTMLPPRAAGPTSNSGF
jgi:hypothetical protein